MEPDLVWYVLRDVSDYREQLRLSTVCKEWSLVCKSLPSLTITCNFFRFIPTREQACQVLEKAIQGRSNLRELEVSLMSEQDFFDTVQHVSLTIEKLTLRRLTYLGWTRLQQGFPKLLYLKIFRLDLLERPGNLKLPTLKRLDISGVSGGVPGSVVAEIIRSCPSLEDFTAQYKGPVHLRSDILVRLVLLEASSGESETVIEACNLKSLRIGKTSPSLVLRAGNIEYLDVFSCEDGLRIPPLHQLKVLRLGSLHTVPKLHFLSSLKHLIIRKFHSVKVETETPAETVTLQQFVPQELEVLCFDVELNITADEMFRKEMETEAEILELLLGPADDLPCFPSLKSVVVTFHEDKPVKLAIPVLVQLLRCSPLLERLLLRAYSKHPPTAGLLEFEKLDTRVRLIRTSEEAFSSTLLYPECLKPVH